jgi:hypothetical protein
VRRVYSRHLWVLAVLFPVLWLLASGASHFVAVAKCNGAPFPAASYIAYCLDRDYGDYEHEAFFFGLNRTAEALAETKVLFLGNSKLQYALSRANVGPFFAERNARFFVMGFGHGEQSRFAELVLQRHPARPTVAVINVDPYFTDGITEPAAFPVHHPIAGWIDAVFKSVVQRPRAWLCRAGSSPVLERLLCRGEPAMLRSEVTGQWDVTAFREEPEPPYALPAVVPVADDALDQWLAHAAVIAPAFLRTLGARCVVFTAVPSEAGSVYGRRLAAELRVPFIAPVVAGLTTIDHVHLDAKSGVAWSDALLRELDPVGRACGAW